MNVGGINTDPKMKKGRKFCFGCGHVFNAGDSKSSFDFVHYFCDKDECQRLMEKMHGGEDLKKEGRPDVF